MTAAGLWTTSARSPADTNDDRGYQRAETRSRKEYAAALTVALDPRELDEILADGRALADSAIASDR
jgi:hypothetical protein